MKAKQILIELKACSEAKEWAGDRTVEEAWKECERGDWMLWFYARRYPKNKRQLTLAIGHCVNTVRHLMKDKRSIAAVDAAIDYGNALKEATDAYTADAAYYAAAATDAANVSMDYAADDAAYTATAYYAAADIADTYTADADAAKKRNQKLTADICRKYLTLGDPL